MYKVAVLGLLFVMTAAYIKTIFTGRTQAKKRGAMPVDPHRRKARFVLLLSVFLVLVVKAGVRLKGETRLDDLFAIHLSFALPFLLTILLLNYRLNGKRSRHHWRLAYASAPLLLGMLSTGIPMILFRF